MQRKFQATVEDDRDEVDYGRPPPRPQPLLRSPTPEPPRNRNQMQIKISDANDNKVQFDLKPTTKLGKLKKAYAAEKQLDLHLFKFVFAGVFVLDDHTPEIVSNVTQCT